MSISSVPGSIPTCRCDSRLPTAARRPRPLPRLSSRLRRHILSPNTIGGSQVKGRAGTAPRHATPARAAAAAPLSGRRVPAEALGRPIRREPGRKDSARPEEVGVWAPLGSSGRSAPRAGPAGPAPPGGGVARASLLGRTTRDWRRRVAAVVSGDLADGVDVPPHVPGLRVEISQNHVPLCLRAPGSQAI